MNSDHINELDPFAKSIQLQNQNRIRIIKKTAVNLGLLLFENVLLIF
jgi:hypothetical protein